MRRATGGRADVHGDAGDAGGGRRRGGRRHARALRARHLGVVRGDDRRAERPAGRRARGRRRALGADVDDEHRRVPVERGRGRAARDHPPQRARAARRADADDARADGAPQAQRPVLQLVRPPRRGQAHQVAADRRGPRPDPLLRRQRLAGDRAADRRAQRAAARRARPRAVRLDGLRLLLRAGAEPDPVPLLARQGHRAVLLRHGRLREPDRRLRRDRQGRAAEQGVLRALALVPGLLPVLVPGDAPERLRPQLRGRDGLRGQLSVRLHAADAELGRLDVRGADAGPVRARGALGRGLVADEPPVHRRRADRPRPERREVRHVGLLALQHARGRLRRLRRRRGRHGPERDALQRGPHARRPRLRGLRRAGRRCPTRRRARTRTASSRRTRRSSACATGARRRSRTWRGSSGSRAPTAAGASPTRSTSAPASRRRPGSRSTRA